MFPPAADLPRLDGLWRGVLSNREPRLKPVAVSDLRPTQMTVGFREVAEKRRAWTEIAEKSGADFLGRHLVPVLLGPKGHPYVIDHHHLARALLDEGVEEVATTVVADLSSLDRDAFWVVADNRGWCHPYDGDGVRCTFKDIPRSIAGLKDDPYRSLAGELRRAGGYAKETIPFTEFLWADFLRRNIKAKLVDEDFPAALTKALKLAKSTKAQYLPGWAGPVPEG
jgi:hypothetical protein